MQDAQHPRVHLFSHNSTTANSCATTFQRSQQSPRSWRDSRLPYESLTVRIHHSQNAFRIHNTFTDLSRIFAIGFGQFQWLQLMSWMKYVITQHQKSNFLLENGMLLQRCKGAIRIRKTSRLRSVSRLLRGTEFQVLRLPDSRTPWGCWTMLKVMNRWCRKDVEEIVTHLWVATWRPLAPWRQSGSEPTGCAWACREPKILRGNCSDCKRT